MLYRYNYNIYKFCRRPGRACRVGEASGSAVSQMRMRSKVPPPGLDKCLEHHLLTNPRLNSSHTAMPMSNCFRCIYDLYTLHYFATHVYKLNICIQVVSTYIRTGSEILKKHVVFEQKKIGRSQQRFDLDYRIGMDRHLDGGLAAGFCVHTLFWVWIKHVWDSPKNWENHPAICEFCDLWACGTSAPSFGGSLNGAVSNDPRRENDLFGTQDAKPCDAFSRCQVESRNLFSCSHSCPLPFYRRM